jgi:hypothetical protein
MSPIPIGDHRAKWLAGRRSERGFNKDISRAGRDWPREFMLIARVHDGLVKGDKTEKKVAQ